MAKVPFPNSPAGEPGITPGAIWNPTPQALPPLGTITQGPPAIPAIPAIPDPPPGQSPSEPPSQEAPPPKRRRKRANSVPFPSAGSANPGVPAFDIPRPEPLPPAPSPMPAPPGPQPIPSPMPVPPPVTAPAQPRVPFNIPVPPRPVAPVSGPLASSPSSSTYAHSLIRGVPHMPYDQAQDPAPAPAPVPAPALAPVPLPQVQQANPIPAPSSFRQAVPEQAQQAVAVLPGIRSQTVVRTPFGNGARLELDMSDITIPRVSVVQNVGMLRASYNPGTLVLDRKLVIPVPMPFVVLNALPKRFIEVVPGGVGGRVANSAEEVFALGGALTRREAEAAGRPWFATLAQFVFLLCWTGQPELLSHYRYVCPLDDSRWMLASMSFKKTQYKVAKIFYTSMAMQQMRNHLAAVVWAINEVYCETYPNSTHSAMVPRVVPVQETSRDFREWIDKIKTGADLTNLDAENIGDE